MGGIPTACPRFILLSGPQTGGGIMEIHPKLAAAGVTEKKAAEMAAKVIAAHAQFLERVKATGLPPPRSLEDLHRLARLVEIPEEHIGPLTAGGIAQAAEEWVDLEKEREEFRSKLRTEKSGALPAEPQKPLTEEHQKAFDLICKQGPLTGKQIVNRLSLTSESLFTSKYVPELRKHGIRNRRGLGYYHPDFYKPGPEAVGKR
jgi:hypothetical protein